MKLLNKIAWKAVLITKGKKKERKKSVSELNPDEISNVLAVSSTAIGDTLLSTPAVRAIRCILPNASIDFMVREKFSVLFENNPDIRTIIPYYGGYKRLFSLLNRIKSGNYDLCLVFHDSDPCPVQAAYSAGIPFIARIGFKDETVAPLLNVRVQYRDEAHVIEQRLDVLRTLFKNKLDSPQDRRMVLRIMVGEAEAFWDDLLNGPEYNYTKNKRIGFQISASRPYKTWPHGHFSELGKRLLTDSEDVNIILFGGPGDEKTGKEIAEGITTDPGQKPRIINLAGRLPLEKLPAALKGLDLFITNDTGPFHVAVALKTPTISLFVPSTVRHTGPYQDLEIHQVIRKPRPCSPCIQKYCNDSNCMSIISVEEVYQTTKNSLSQRAFLEG
ncbi:MAG: glycosyltransferase family 9 protein [Deltaproteobacteria bacterium]|nr:glycosyltransferase family 9 protein [Deltaproteobacteria bacterium]MBW1932653.1 glycosyltransferase family 9 protein [Deltaproteobacteria bacterium]MBW1938664.1 glycosyltransferase family 9 protein [Deltaproteobacteria bacterium]MBW1963659.1 glycosyltransferase family 9 protein [Deltaproteobacteria bacterium]MBW2079554.1 glycosyltransferase family 9 protein [Deltaproteobacteria bacterium]